MERLNSPVFEPVSFRYVGDPEAHEKYIDITVETGLGPVSHRKARLPKKLIKKRMILIFPKEKEISIPAWLCKREGLL